MMQRMSSVKNRIVPSNQLEDQDFEDPGDQICLPELTCRVCFQFWNTAGRQSTDSDSSEPRRSAISGKTIKHRIKKSKADKEVSVKPLCDCKSTTVRTTVSVNLSPSELLLQLLLTKHVVVLIPKSVIRIPHNLLCW